MSDHPLKSNRREPQLARFRTNATERANHRGSNYMEVIIGLAIYLAIWAAVIYGAIYFNQNVR
jgi:hypothetical protein